ncbi:hypothetical protein [Streptomonospora wellingtoniae]|uniref:PE-PGRS family protein n=1 Tax=Streptomonospora wellingtoniae TaxID=3075544 RepID=A0ABU2KMX1_9ACTN|nr:hypothetical protein [Streptomonospora sp. DSM 45055]MDT0300616.1 hypothetical protein [Streptomonospora sp. DSM 45055]
MSEYQCYEFLAVDLPLDERQQAEVRAVSTRARITPTSFTNEYHWGDFRGDPHTLMQRYYDAHLYLANWGTHRVMLRLPLALLEPETVEPYRIDPYVDAWTTTEHLILDLTSEAEEEDWDPETEVSLSAIVGVRAELAAGDLRPLYLAWLAGSGTWERDEVAFDYDEEEDEGEPPVPAGLGNLTTPQRALADFLRLDPALLAIAAQASPPLTASGADRRELARWISGLPTREKETLLVHTAQGHGARVGMELLRRFRGEPGSLRDGARPRRSVAELLDAAATTRQERRRHAEAAHAEEEARRVHEQALAREKRLDALARDHEAAWERVDALIHTRRQSDYDAAVDLLDGLREVAERVGQTDEFAQRLSRLRKEHRRKPSLIARFDRAGLSAASPPDGVAR